MDPCTVETGLLRKTPCGQAAVTKCTNCERPLCSKHAIAQVGATGRKTGTFLCGECNAAHRAYEKTFGAAPQPAVKPADKPRPAAQAPAASVTKAPPAGAASAPTPAAAGEGEPSGGIDFTPTKK